MVLINARERSRFIKFLGVGVIGAVVDFGAFNLLNGLFHWGPVVSQVISFIAAVMSNFYWNRRWTYPDSRSKNIWSQLLQFGVVSFVGLAIRTPLFATIETPLVRLAEGSPAVPDFIPPEFLGHSAALAIAVFVVMLWNFFINRFWTYNDVE
jgi:putative flippase GtrA